VWASPCCGCRLCCVGPQRCLRPCIAGHLGYCAGSGLTRVVEWRGACQQTRQRVGVRLRQSELPKWLGRNVVRRMMAAVESLRGLLANESATDPIGDRILAAAAELVGRQGDQQTTMAAIAQQAGVGRATVFRRFGSKQEILDRALMRELRMLALSLQESATNAETAAAALIECFVLSMRAMRRRALLRRLAQLEPEKLIAFTRLQRPPVLALWRSMYTSIVETFDTQGVDPSERAALGDVLIHLTLGYSLVPESSIDLRDDEKLRRVAASVIMPVLGQ
jgi:AcrR family transcriptional regulator